MNLLLKRSDMARYSKRITQFLCHPLLPSRRASPPFGWYSMALMDGQAELTNSSDLIQWITRLGCHAGESVSCAKYWNQFMVNMTWTIWGDAYNGGVFWYAAACRWRVPWPVARTTAHLFKAGGQLFEDLLWQSDLFFVVWKRLWLDILWLHCLILMFIIVNISQTCCLFCKVE